MGEEAPEYLLDRPDECLPVGFDPESRGYQTSTVLGDKIYVVGESNDAADLSINVRIFDKSTGTWLVPAVLGMKPVPSEGHSTVLLNEDRILILKWNSLSDDCTWFLEVDTPFIKEQKKVHGTEVVAWSKGVKGDGPKPIVISGPSGVGKGTLISKLMKEFPTTFGFSVSHTTRAPREKEIDGVHYHFTDRSIMEKDIRDGKFLESASVHGNLYGTSMKAVEAVTDAGKRCILDIDVQGARSVKASTLEAMLIFICPPSFDELEKRLRARGTENEEQVQKRLRNARAELDQGKSTYQGKSTRLFDHILVNDDLHTSYENLKVLLGLDKRTVFQTYKKVLIHCGTNELAKASPSLFVLDVSSLKGGAPAWTRGLNLYLADSISDLV